METSPRPMDRWIPFLGFALIVIAGVGYHSRMRTNDRFPAVYLTQIVCAAVAGGASLLTRRLRPRVVHRLSFTALGVYCVYVAFDSLRYQFSLNALQVVGTIGFLFQLAGIPLMWGSALSRREDPTRDRTQRYGRMAAGLVQLSFVLLFVSELRSFFHFDSSQLSSMSSPAAAIHALERVVETVERVLLLWASVLCMRTSADPPRIQEWAARTHRLIFVSFGAGLLALALNLVPAFGRDADGTWQSPLLPWIWRGVLAATLTLLSSFTMPPCFRTASTGYNSGPAPHP